MISINKALILTFALLPAHTIALEVCGNDADFDFSVNDKDRSCSWFRLKEDRREKFCLIDSINNACKHSCGACCEDDTTYRFERNNGIEADCAWIGQGQIENRIKRYCLDTIWRNGSTVRDACPRTCDYCFEKIDVAPSAGPSTIVTAVPVTSAPTKTAGPSAEPTRPPSPMPSPFPTSLPTSMPSDTPSEKPSVPPSNAPTSLPSDQPSSKPSSMPSNAPSGLPSDQPSDAPSNFPSDQPSSAPSSMPSDQPSASPSDQPSVEPSGLPSDTPTRNPSSEPSISPTNNPTASIKPSASPTGNPTGITDVPTKSPTMAPVIACDDNVDFTFTLPNVEETRNCNWLKKNKNDSVTAKRQKRLCGKSENGKSISVECCAGCKPL